MGKESLKEFFDSQISTDEKLEEIKKGTKTSAIKEIAMIVRKVLTDKQLKQDIAGRIEDVLQNESYGSSEEEAQKIADNVVALMFENDQLDFSIQKTAERAAREALKQAKS